MYVSGTPRPPLLTNRFENALVDAFRLHQNQTRKVTDVPYIAHLLGVTSLVLDAGGSEDEAIAALLHDAVEDQGGLKTARKIRRKYGDTAADLVMACTEAVDMATLPYQERKSNYIARLATQPLPVLNVSSADKLHNARSVLGEYRQQGEAIWKHFHGGREGVLWYYRALVDAYRKRGYHTPNVTELSRVVTELERLVGASSGQKLNRQA